MLCCMQVNNNIKNRNRYIDAETGEEVKLTKSFWSPQQGCVKFGK